MNEIKQALRHRMKRLNRQLPAEQKRMAAERIFAEIEGLPAFREARCVACYCALPDEPPTEAVLHRWSCDRRVVVPRVEGDTMQFYDYRPEAMARGAFGIDEPVAADASHRCPHEAIDLLVAPGVAFTRDGARLGRGRGYYDRYLAQPEVHACCVGVCFAHQLVDALPVEPHDRTMDFVFTAILPTFVSQ